MPPKRFSNKINHNEKISISTSSTSDNVIVKGGMKSILNKKIDVQKKIIIVDDEDQKSEKEEHIETNDDMSTTNSTSNDISNNFGKLNAKKWDPSKLVFHKVSSLTDKNNPFIINEQIKEKESSNLQEFEKYIPSNQKKRNWAEAQQSSTFNEIGTNTYQRKIEKSKGNKEKIK